MTRIVVTAGGTPTPLELAAIVAVLEADGQPPPEPPATPPLRRPAPWLLAARLEAAGAAQLASPDEVRVAAGRRGWAGGRPGS